MLQRVKKKIFLLEFSWILKKSYLVCWNSLKVLRRRWSKITMFEVFNLLGFVESFVRFGSLRPVEPFASWFVGIFVVL
mgnify:CR=1 FL=1